MKEYIIYLPTVKVYNFIADTKNQQFQRSLHLFLTKSSLLELSQLKLHTEFINTALSFCVKKSLYRVIKKDKARCIKQKPSGSFPLGSYRATDDYLQQKS